MSVLQLVALSVYLLTILLGLLVAFECVKRRYVSPTARYLPLVMVGVIWWGLCQSAQLLPLGDPVQMLGYVLFPFAMPFAAGGFWSTVHTLIDRNYRPSSTESTAFFAILVACAATLSVPVTRDLVMHRVSIDGVAQVWQLGPLFWLMAGLTGCAFVAAAVVDVRAMKDSASLQRAQLGSTLAGAVAPAVGMLATLVQLVAQDGRVPLPVVEWTAVGFIATTVLALYSLHYQGLLSGVPVARGLILEELGQGVLVFDRDGRLVDLNTAARALLSSTLAVPGEILGRPLSYVLSCLGPGVRPDTGEYCVNRGGRPLEIDLRVQAIESGGQVVGQAIVIRDVTAYNESRRALAMANDRLRTQLTTIEGLRAELAEQANRDALTGLHNRRFLDAGLASEVAAAHEQRTPLSVGILDVDHFKAINDTHGHLVGDQVLVTIGQRLSALVSGRMSVTRFGGEEFVIVMPGQEVVEAAATLCGLQASMSTTAIDTTAGSLAVTMSGGLATLGPRVTTPHDLLSSADRALYAAKAAGRNRVEVARARTT